VAQLSLSELVFLRTSRLWSNAPDKCTDADCADDDVAETEYETDVDAE